MVIRFTLITLVSVNILSSGLQIRAMGVEGEAVLCKRQNLFTTAALSTKEYNSAICWNQSTDKGYFIGQSKKDNRSIFLPLKVQYKLGIGSSLQTKMDNNGDYTYQAVDQQYTYQVFLKSNDTCGSGEWASLTVFKSGNKIYHEKVNNFLAVSDC